jgi:small subunit ribosomal protein S8
MMTDPIADMLTRIRNAAKARHAQTTCPSSKLKLAIAQVLKQEGFVAGVSSTEKDGHPAIAIELRYDDEGKIVMDGMRRVSKPGCRVYVGAKDVPKVRSGMGMAVLSTSKGVLCDRDARAQNVGGEVLCEVW